MTNDAVCPICGSESVFIQTLKAEFILNQLELYYDESPPDQLGIVNYDMLSCKRCSLEFAWPMQSGSVAFYSWLSTRRRYYPTSRWEWIIVLEKLRRRDSGQIILLDIGCGEGEFISLAQEIPGVIAIGLDTTKRSVERCNARGLEVYCETIESFLLNRDRDAKCFDFIVLFHCLEHVSDPKGLVASLLLILKPAGKIIISTPYSPMSFERVWFDPLNHPPHHLTRWNVVSYNELARQLNLQIKLFMPSADSAINRTIHALNLAWNGPANLASKRRMMILSLQQPLTTFKEWIVQRNREKINRQAAADVVLVELSHN